MTDRGAFSICAGGRLHEMLTRAGFAAGARRQVILVSVLLAVGLLPLLILSAVAGTAFGGAGRPFFHDLAPWVRYLLVVPALLLAEPYTDRLAGVVVDTFRRSRIVGDSDLPAFEAAVDKAGRTATSDAAELILLLIALALPHLAFLSLPQPAIGVGWYATVVGSEPHLTAAGYWYTWVSLPLVEFLIMRWLWRAFAWGRLLWRVSRLDLALAPAHPDRSAGLGFLAWSPLAFLPLCVGLSMLTATGLAKLIESGGASLTDALGPITALVLCECLLLLAPHFFFSGALRTVRDQALIGYGLAATTMSREFESHWTGPGSRPGAELLDNSESSSMIDYAGTYGLVQGMQPIAGVSLRLGLMLVLVLAAPFAPLLLYKYSVKEILVQVLQLVR